MKNKTLEEMIDDVAKKMADRFATQFKNEIYKEMEKIQGKKNTASYSYSSGCGSSVSGGCGSSTSSRSRSSYSNGGCFGSSIVHSSSC